MIALTPFVVDDIFEIEVQPEQQGHMIDAHSTAQTLLQAGPTVTARGGNGRILMIGSLIPLFSNNALVHALLAREILHDMVALTRATRTWFDDCGFYRLTAWVDPSHSAAMRWIGLLGFKQEAVMPHFGDGGQTIISFARFAATTGEE